MTDAISDQQAFSNGVEENIFSELPNIRNKKLISVNRKVTSFFSSKSFIYHLVNLWKIIR